MWLQPLTNRFRMLLEEEFSTCTDISPQEQLALNCLRAVENGYKESQDEGLRTIYGEDSVLTLILQAGEYKGTDAIVEYFAYFSSDQSRFSLSWDFCTVSLNSRRLVGVSSAGLPTSTALLRISGAAFTIALSQWSGPRIL